MLSLAIPAATFAQKNDAQNLPPALARQIASGVEALKAGDLEAAERVFSAALRQGARHPLVFHNLGLIAQQRGNHRQAVTRFRQAILLQPDHGPSRLLLGSSLLALHQKAEAARQLVIAAKLMPNQPQAHLQLAYAYQALGNWMGAAQELEKLVKVAPREPEYSYQLARAWTKLAQWSYHRIVQLNPQSARLQQALGQEYVVQEKYDLAMAAFQKAARIDPKLPEIHLAMALIWLEGKRVDEALAEIELELKLVPESKAAAETKARIEAAKAASPP